MSSHSILPLDHFTTGLSREQLKGLIERHAVRFEVSPYQGVGSAGELVREGWTIDLYGSRSASDKGLGHDEATRHVHDVLHSLAICIRPAIPEGLVIEDEPFHGKTVMDPQHDFAEEVQKRIYVLRDSSSRPTMVGESDTEWTHVLSFELESLGAARR
jgi:hypothetical protein